MILLKLIPAAALMLAYQVGGGDASYESITQMSGGAGLSPILNSPFAPKEVKTAFDPKSTITVVHGNRKAIISKERTEIDDIDQQTVTRIDNVKRTYSVMTFAQLREVMKEMPQKLAEMNAKLKQAQATHPNQPASDVQMTFDTQVKDTGVTKVVNGLNADEWIVTVTSKVATPAASPTDPPVDMSYVTTTEIWIAPEPPVLKEIRDFDARMGAKMSEGLDMQAIAAQMKAAGANANFGMMFGQRPGAADSMAEMRKQMEKIKGFRVMEVTTMTMKGMPAPPPGAAPQTPPPATPTGSQVAGQVASDTATQTASAESSKLGVFGGAFANSALKAFGHKKSAPPPPAATTPAAGTSSGPGPLTVAADGSMVLMSTTTQMTHFSQEPVPPSAFQIPAGYKQVDNPKGIL